MRKVSFHVYPVNPASQRKMSFIYWILLCACVRGQEHRNETSARGGENKRRKRSDIAATGTLRQPWGFE